SLDGDRKSGSIWRVDGAELEHSNARRLDCIFPAPQNFVGESVAISNHPLAMHGGRLTVRGGSLTMRGGSIAFLQCLKKFVEESIAMSTGLWQCTEAFGSAGRVVCSARR